MRPVTKKDIQPSAYVTAEGQLYEIEEVAPAGHALVVLRNCSDLCAEEDEVRRSTINDLLNASKYQFVVPEPDLAVLAA